MTGRIPLRGRDGRARAYALVDGADLAAVSQFRWRLDPDGYAMRTQYLDGGRRCYIRMHRALLDAPEGSEVDHINRERLDNRRANLRLVSDAGTSQNRGANGGTSRHRGVTWSQTHKKWQARAGLDGRLVHLGYYANEDEAAAVASAWRAQHMPFAVEGPR